MAIFEDATQTDIEGHLFHDDIIRMNERLSERYPNIRFINCTEDCAKTIVQSLDTDNNGSVEIDEFEDSSDQENPQKENELTIKESERIKEIMNKSRKRDSLANMQKTIDLGDIDGLEKEFKDHQCEKIMIY